MASNCFLIHENHVHPPRFREQGKWWEKIHQLCVMKTPQHSREGRLDPRGAGQGEKEKKKVWDGEVGGGEGEAPGKFSWDRRIFRNSLMWNRGS